MPSDCHPIAQTTILYVTVLIPITNQYHMERGQPHQREKLLRLPLYITAGVRRRLTDKTTAHFNVGLCDYGKNHNHDYFWSIIDMTIIKYDYSLTLKNSIY